MLSGTCRRRKKRDGKQKNAVYTGKAMDLRELELIDIEADEQLVRKAKKRKTHHSEKERKQKREIEAWPMEAWASREVSARKNGGKVRGLDREDWAREGRAKQGDSRKSVGELQEGRKLRAAEWETEEEWEENWEEEEWEEDWEEEEWEEDREEEQDADERLEESRKEQKRTVQKSEEKKRRKKRKRRARMIRSMATGFAATIMAGTLLGAGYLAVYVYREWKGKEDVQTISTIDVEKETKQDIREWAKFYAMELERPPLAVDLLTMNEYSRPGEALPEVKSIFIHYTANAGTTAEQNRSYFESLAESHERSASAHFVIGIDGTIVQCIPTKEIAYAVKGRNYDSISIECCYLDENGRFEEETYQKLIELTAWLLHKYELRPENVLRHYDEGGKNCPKYYVEHEEAWQGFLNDLRAYMTSMIEE